MTIAFEGESFRVRIVSRAVRTVAQQFEIAARPPVVLCIPRTLQGNIVLVRQYRPAVAQHTLEFPAGSIGPGEDPETAIRRELLEEAGFHAVRLRSLATFRTAPHFSDELITAFVASGQIVSSPTPTPKEELMEVLQIAPAAVRKLIEGGQLSDSKSIAAYMLASILDSAFGMPR